MEDLKDSIIMGRENHISQKAKNEHRTIPTWNLDIKTPVAGEEMERHAIPDGGVLH